MKTSFPKHMKHKIIYRFGFKLMNYIPNHIKILHLPFPDSNFDVLLANHMLYHVSDIQSAIRDTMRVLRPGGYLIAATNAITSMIKTDWEIETAFETLGDPIQVPPTPPLANFCLENGGAFFETEFQNV